MQKAKGRLRAMYAAAIRIECPVRVRAVRVEGIRDGALEHFRVGLNGVHAQSPTCCCCVDPRRGACPLCDCICIDDLWRGRLHVELQLLETISQQIEQVDEKLDALGAQDERVQLLQSMPGVGPRLAETVVVHLDDPHRFKSAAHVASYAGLVPKQMETGTMKRSGRITRRGPALLRSMLVEVAWMVYIRNDWAKHYVQRISRGMASRKNIAIVALARKLLVTPWAMLRDNTRWRGPKARAIDAALTPAVAMT